MTFAKATLLLTKHGADHVTLWTNLPSPMPAVTDQSLILTFSSVKNGGEQYVKDNFPNIPYNVIPDRYHHKDL